MRCYISGAITGVKHADKLFESQQKKEDLLFGSAVFFLRELGKSKNITVEDIEPDDRFEVTEKGKEYLNSH